MAALVCAVVAVLIGASCSAPASVDAERCTPAAGPQGWTKPVSFSVLEDYDKGASLEEVARDFALMRELDVYTWRGSLGWDDYEPAPDQYEFAWLHLFADLAARHGIALRPYIAFTAPWAASNGQDDQYWNDPPARLTEWYELVYQLASALRRHSNVLSYEIYNEEDLSLWWEGTKEEYSAVLAQGAAAVRAADPDAEVLLGGLAHPDAEWAEAICEVHGNAGSFDIAPFHVYLETWVDIPIEGFVEGEDYARFAATVARACGGKPIWVNEAGYATTPGRSEEQQANWWARAVATLLAVPEIEHIGIYEIKDLEPDSPVIGDETNYHLGITHTDRTKKLAFYTLDMLTDLLDVETLTVLDQAAQVTVVSGQAGVLHHHLFRRPDGRQVLFVWDETGAPTVDITLAAGGSAAIEHALSGMASPYPLRGCGTLAGVRLAPGQVRIFEILALGRDRRRWVG